jgi:hypothetical protein
MAVSVASDYADVIALINSLAAGTAGGYLPLAGGTLSGAVSGTTISLSGALTAPSATLTGGEVIRVSTAGGYFAFFNGGTREGYLQGNAGGLIISSETGVLTHSGAGGHNFTGGRVDFGSQSITGLSGVINGYTMSEGVIGNRVVLAGSAGYINGNYFNMTANIDAGQCQYVAGMSGSDNYLRWFTKVGAYKDYSATNWTDCAIVSNGYTQAAIALYAQGYDAPYMRFYGPFTRIDFVNSAGGYYNVGGASFTNPSSIKIKENVVVTPDDPLLQELFWIQTKKFDKKDSFPQVMRPSPKFTDINDRWVAKGRKKLKLPDREIIYIDHDCGTQDCPGTAESPCAGVRNHHAAHGLIAEEVFERFPEAVSVGMDGDPEGLFLEQIAGLALGGVAALTREVVKLMERTYKLEGFYGQHRFDGSLDD